jgi:hypothetical protein
MMLADLISTIDSEIAALEKARSVLAEDSDRSRSGSGRSRNKKRRKLSAEARKRIADAQRKRWAEYKKAGGKAA